MRAVMSAEAIEAWDPKPAVCTHTWKTCSTPPDSGNQWFRCTECQVFGYRKYRRDITPYRCTKRRAVGTQKICGKPAIDREKGRGPRGSYLWVCHDHCTH